MKIITVSREFGSGGREVGKRLADILGYDYFDREILTELASKINMDEAYIETTLNSGILRSIPINFSRTLSHKPVTLNTASLLSQQHKIIKEIAGRGKNFIIVGRSANVILSRYNTFNIFVYADMENKIKRCRERGANQGISDKELEKEIKRIDRGRAECHSLVSNKEWGDKSGYHLCINTTNMEIKKITPLIAEFADSHFTEV